MEPARESNERKASTQAGSEQRRPPKAFPIADHAQRHTLFSEGKAVSCVKVEAFVHRAGRS
eukprot:13312286-Alexandrium_andersonii.AAC.1